MCFIKHISTIVVGIVRKNKDIAFSVVKSRLKVRVSIMLFTPFVLITSLYQNIDVFAYGEPRGDAIEWTAEEKSTYFYENLGGFILDIFDVALSKKGVAQLGNDIEHWCMDSQYAQQAGVSYAEFLARELGLEYVLKEPSKDNVVDFEPSRAFMNFLEDKMLEYKENEGFQYGYCFDYEDYEKLILPLFDSSYMSEEEKYILRKVNQRVPEIARDYDFFCFDNIYLGGSPFVPMVGYGNAVVNVRFYNMSDLSRNFVYDYKDKDSGYAESYHAYNWYDNKFIDCYGANSNENYSNIYPDFMIVPYHMYSFQYVNGSYREVDGYEDINSNGVSGAGFCLKKKPSYDILESSYSGVKMEGWSPLFSFHNENAYRIYKDYGDLQSNDVPYYDLDHSVIGDIDSSNIDSFNNVYDDLNGSIIGDNNVYSPTIITYEYIDRITDPDYVRPTPTPTPTPSGDKDKDKGDDNKPDNNSGGGGSGGIFDFLDGLGDVLGNLIKNLGELLVDLLGAITEVFTTLTETLPQNVVGFFGSLLSWLPEDVWNLVRLAMVLGLIGIVVKKFLG